MGTAPGEAVATFGAGCFWCVEAVLQQRDGVLRVTSGYMGGHTDAPTYEEVCTGRTGHAEVVQVVFDPTRVTYADLVEQFWRLHDPTTRNRQGGDVGTQYRSVIFVHDAAQRRVAEASRAALDASGDLPVPVVTEIVDAGPFHPAEDYHRDYYRQHRSAAYCQAVIAPKLRKLGLED